ncbi:AraC-like DNA-binding protein [Flavobacterium sp. 2755]|uniref:helix-turn-helix domain-containing protein n=1 Tax=Flavobacterium sp. 2755 TaxID=2817765 RepID=UPI0028552044|nr:helix-turn-helix domain-containing protein [Flavobacterium sp. 2755]MDR6761893.1 AraC-like DNA-binding protein [Flavobacterium sp. 2755]
MLKDLINKELNRGSFFGVTVYLVKKSITNSHEGESFRVDQPAVLLLKSGILKIQSLDLVLELDAGDLVILPKKVECRVMEAGNRLQFFLLVFSFDRKEPPFHNQNADSVFYLAGSKAMKIHLEDSDYLVLSLICRLLYAAQYNQASGGFERELRRLSSNLLFFELKFICSKYFTSAQLYVSRAEQLTVQFLTVLSIHCRKHHNVKFYAGALYVTSGYLNRVVKQVTGKPAKKMITEAVLAEAVNLLEDSQYTIAEVAEELEFSTLSAFDIFFKRLIFCTPSEYRSNAIERFKSR